MKVKSKNDKKEKAQAKATVQADNKATPSASAEAAISQPDLRFRDEVASHPGGENIRRCFACGTCAASCPVTEIDSEYNCRRIIRQINLGMRQEVLSSPLIWMCLVCYRCYARCPQQVNFTDIMRVLRYLSVKEKCFSPEVFEQIAELDKFSQVVRRKLFKGLFENKPVSLEQLENKIDKVIKETLEK